MQQGLLITLIVIGSILIILLFLQSGRVRNVGASIIGTQNVELFENIKKRGGERFLHWLTVTLVIIFLIIAMVMFLYV